MENNRKYDEDWLPRTIKKEKDSEDVLKYHEIDANIDTAYIRSEDCMRSKNLSLLDKHEYNIWQYKDGNWYTKLPDKKKGGKLIKRKSKEKLLEAICDFYKAQEEKPKTFDDVYWNWRRAQDECVVDNTTVKYDTDYARYFKGTAFAAMPIEEINVETVKVFISRTVKSQELCKKACKTLFWYIKSTITSAKANGLINTNFMEYLAAKDFYRFCEERDVPDDKKVVSPGDMELLYEQFIKDYEKKPSYIPTYAVHFAKLTAMRVGEVSALTWDCVSETHILINKSEKYDRKTKSYYIGKTKNKKSRIFPMTAEMWTLLCMVKQVEERYGFTSEWVFSDANGRVHAPIISSCIKKE